MDDSTRAIYLLDKKIIDGSQKSPIVLEISGNSQTILETWRRGVNRGGDYKYLKINVSGAGVQSFNYCLSTGSSRSAHFFSSQYSYSEATASNADSTCCST